ncbi:hypothetical protein Salat_0204600 [Sesamum alatum]|uniref:Uncharacterized protein n=1 Tax=Sesamum alatum TaxID=300844 RepID=A0AAE1YYM6_9LAMI|nr:hypothetical protein Salat_0204600 [Sesamum alatum]
MAADEPLDDLVSVDGSSAAGHPLPEEVLNRLLSEFNLSEFLALANRVIDDGDLSSMEVITDLKRRWHAKFGDSHSHPFMDVHPSSSHTLAPFQSITIPLRPARRIPRLPTSEQMMAYLEPPPVPLLTLAPVTSTASSPTLTLSGVAATQAPPSACTVLEGSQQDPDLMMLSFQDDDQPQPSIQVKSTSFQFDSLSIHGEAQPQHSLPIMEKEPPSHCTDLASTQHGPDATFTTS